MKIEFALASKSIYHFFLVTSTAPVPEWTLTHTLSLLLRLSWHPGTPKATLDLNIAVEI